MHSYIHGISPCLRMCVHMLLCLCVFVCVYLYVCGAGNDGVLKQSTTPSGLSLSVPSIMVQLLMIPVHTPAQSESGQLEGSMGKIKRGTETEEKKERERAIDVIVERKVEEAAGIKRDKEQEYFCYDSTVCYVI